MNFIWNEIEDILEKSKCKVVIYDEDIENGNKECEELCISKGSVLECIITNCNGIFIDNWIRILGQNSKFCNGILHYNGFKNSYTDGMLIVANDIVGGLFAINITRFENDREIIWYFAPDTLEWECLDMNYSDFILWTALGNIDEFYESMRWNDWIEDCKKVEFNDGYLIYPFIWAEECDINKADKKKVPFDELMEVNFDMKLVMSN